MKTGRATININRHKTKDLLLRHPNFVAKSPNARRELSPLACEASALTTELTAQNHFYFSPKNQPCKEDRPVASLELCTDTLLCRYLVVFLPTILEQYIEVLWWMIELGRDK